MNPRMKERQAGKTSRKTAMNKGRRGNGDDFTSPKQTHATKARRTSSSVSGMKRELHHLMEEKLNQVFGERQEIEEQWERRGKEHSAETRRLLEELKRSHDEIDAVKKYVLQQYDKHASLMQRSYRNAERKSELDGNGLPKNMPEVAKAKKRSVKFIQRMERLEAKAIKKLKL